MPSVTPKIEILLHCTMTRLYDTHTHTHTHTIYIYIYIYIYILSRYTEFILNKIN